MATRLIGGVTYTIREVENYLGQQYIVVADVLPANMATLGAPENSQVYVMCNSVLYMWNGTAWVNFYPAGTSTPGPANTLSIGSVTTLAAGASATASITGVSPNQTLSLGVPRGSNGTAGTNGTNGAANSLSIGSVTALSAGATPTATITGTAPTQTLSLGIPAGANGTNGSNAPANSLSIGTVTSLSAGASPTATITGTAPSQLLSLGIPAGAAGGAGTNGTNGTNGVGVTPGAPAAMTIAFATAYQVADPTKAAHINIMLESNYVTTVAGTSADEIEVRIGPTNGVATGSGTQVATWKTSLTGISLTVGLGLIQRNPVAFMLPIGWYFAVRRISGTTATISSTLAQPLG